MNEIDRLTAQVKKLREEAEKKLKLADEIQSKISEIEKNLKEAKDKAGVA